MKYWRSLGHKIVMFLDDGIGGDSCYDLILCFIYFTRIPNSPGATSWSPYI